VGEFFLLVPIHVCLSLNPMKITQKKVATDVRNRNWTEVKEHTGGERSELETQ
jgi:hypothetical protein